VNDVTPEPFDFPKPEIEELQVADITAPVGANGGVVSRVFSVKQPEEDADDFEIYVRASTLKRVRNYLTEIKESKFPIEELLLAAASLLLGACFGAIPSEIGINNPKYFWYFQVFPIAGCSCLVAYIFLRNQTQTNLISTAKTALKELPDPERAK